MTQRILRRPARVAAIAAAIALACLLAQPELHAQRGAAPAPPQSPWAAASIDLTGYWVSIVNEDWRWRMVTPPKGDTASVPLNPRGTQVANEWDPATDGSCKAFGAAGLMRMPTRLHITWADDHTLKIESDNGEQTRLLRFGTKDRFPHEAGETEHARERDGLTAHNIIERIAQALPRREAGKAVGAP